MALGFFTVRASIMQILPQHKSTRRVILIGGVIYVATAGVLHFFIGSLADWTTTLAPLLGREETTALIRAQYSRLMPAMLIAYAGMLLLILAVHMLVWQIVLALIPDIRQALGAEISI